MSAEKSEENKERPEISRRNALAGIGRGLGLLAVAGIAAGVGKNKDDTVWQIDPHKCTQCGKCATSCVVDPSAVKCVHTFEKCGYCRICMGFSKENRAALDEAAENQICPTAAITRKFVEEPYYEYTIEEKLCIGCAKCVQTCGLYGNGSLFLQIRHDLCKNCNDCAIARVCPAQAIKRVPSKTPYILKEA